MKIQLEERKILLYKDTETVARNNTNKEIYALLHISEATNRKCKAKKLRIRELCKK